MFAKRRVSIIYLSGKIWHPAIDAHVGQHLQKVFPIILGGLSPWECLVSAPWECLISGLERQDFNTIGPKYEVTCQWCIIGSRGD